MLLQPVSYFLPSPTLNNPAPAKTTICHCKSSSVLCIHYLAARADLPAKRQHESDQVRRNLDIPQAPTPAISHAHHPSLKPLVARRSPQPGPALHEIYSDSHPSPFPAVLRTTTTSPSATTTPSPASSGTTRAARPLVRSRRRAARSGCAATVSAFQAAMRATSAADCTRAVLCTNAATSAASAASRSRRSSHASLKCGTRARGGWGAAGMGAGGGVGAVVSAALWMRMSWRCGGWCCAVGVYAAEVDAVAASARSMLVSEGKYGFSTRGYPFSSKPVTIPASYPK